MKKIIGILLLVSCFLCNSLKAQDSVSYSPVSMYVSGSISLSAMDNFKDGTYPSIEVGACYKYFGLGLNVGRGRLTNMFSDLDSGSEYYWEIKSTASYSVKKLKLFLLFGYGQYFISRNSLIEYGGGVSYPIKNFDIGMQMSSFDGVAYVSPSITYNIQFKQKKRK